MVDLTLTRDLFMVAAIFGVFGFAWAGWGQEGPPPKARPLLGALSGVSLAVAIAGGILAWRNWGEPSSFSGADSGIWFGVIVVVEIVLCAVGAIVLAARGHGGLIAPWISLVVGLHFLPLVFFFNNLTLLAPIIAMVVSAFLAWRAYRRQQDIKPSAITGLINSSVLLLTAAANLIFGLI